jgi:hypothetical protein
LLNKARFYASGGIVLIKLLEFAKRYPIPAFAILGLFVGALFHWPLDKSSLGQHRDDILRKAASVEQLSSYPATQALLQKAEEKKLGGS